MGPKMLLCPIFKSPKSDSKSLVLINLSAIICTKLKTKFKRFPQISNQNPGMPTFGYANILLWPAQPTMHHPLWYMGARLLFLK